MNKLMKLIGIKARRASEIKINSKIKNKVLNDYSKLIDKEKNLIIKENIKDIKFARTRGIEQNLINRLHINNEKLAEIIKSIKKIAKLKDPVNIVLKNWKRPNGLNIKRVTVPIGVIGVIYESRPNVTSDVASLCFKSGNAVILKGGSEAINTNRILANLFKKALKKNKINENFIQFINSRERKIVDIKIIDGLGPDGIASLIKKISIKANKFQSGYIYQYAFVMLLGFSALLTFLIVK